MTNLTSNPLLVAVIVLGIITVVLLIFVIRMHLKMKKFLIDVDADNISESLSLVSSDLKEVQQFKDDMTSYLTDVERRLRKSVQSVHTVRFNPFAGNGEGGKQSFATAFLTEEGDGVVISSLYSRDHVSIFSKPIAKNKPEHNLSDEELEALMEAGKKLKLKKVE